jgi:hypothetical protein
MHTITIPPQLIALREAWRVEVQRLDGIIAPLLFHTFEAPPSLGFAHFQAWNQNHLALLKSWVKRIEAWMNGPLSETISSSETSAQAVNARTSELSRFADELVNHRARLRNDAEKPALRSTVPWFDTMCLSLLEQLRDFMRRVIEALDPDALAASADDARDGAIELDFRFVPDLSVPMANYLAWLRHAHDQLAPYTPELPRPDNQSRDHSGLAAAATLAAALAAAWWLGGTFLAGLIIFVIVCALGSFISRHPLIALIAFLVGIS